MVPREGLGATQTKANVKVDAEAAGVIPAPQFLPQLLPRLLDFVTGVQPAPQPPLLVKAAPRVALGAMLGKATARLVAQAGGALVQVLLRAEQAAVARLDGSRPPSPRTRLMLLVVATAPTMIRRRIALNATYTAHVLILVSLPTLVASPLTG